MWLVETPKNRFPLVDLLKALQRLPGNGSFKDYIAKLDIYVQSFFSFLLSDMCGFFFFGS